MSGTGKPWKIGIEHPSAAGKSLQRVLLLKNQAVATSGDYRIHRTVDGERFPHVLDPRGGRPVRTEVASTTAICDSAAEADAVATAMMVLGPVRGGIVARREGWPVQWIVRHGDEFVVTSTEDFDPLTIEGTERNLLSTLLAGFGVIALSMLGLAIGRLFRGRQILGSCRGKLDPSACDECPAISSSTPRGFDSTHEGANGRRTQEE